MSVALTRLPARIRQASEADIEDMWTIEKGVYGFPWTQGIFMDCMNAGYDCWLYENAREIFGYGITSMLDGECHILNLCIETSYQGLGWGRGMLNHLLDSAREQGCRVVFLEVRISNTRAYSLYRALGFNEVTVRKNYYPDAGGKRENAFVLAKILS